MQIQKAAAHYRPATSPLNVDFRHYYVGNGVVGGATRIYFAQCDAGKSVIIGEFYTNGTVSPYRNQQFQITSDSTQFDPVLNLPYIDISTVAPAQPVFPVFRPAGL